MTAIFVKTIQSVGAATTMSYRAFFKDEPAYNALCIQETRGPSIFSSIRAEIRIILILYVILCTAGAIFLMNRIVASEYALSTLSKTIREEEVLKTSRLSEYSAIASSHTLAETLEQKAKNEFVSVERIRYIHTPPIVQANAVFK